MTIDYLTFSNLIIDDIIFPDGTTSMNTLGGAGLHAVVGMRVWSDRVGYAAAVGEDLDIGHREALTRFGLDLRGLMVRKGFKTPRYWLVMEWDDRRIEISRTSEEDYRRMWVLSKDLPPSYRQARGFHIAWGSVPEVRDLIIELRRVNPNLIIVHELSTENLGESAAEYRQMLPHLTLFSPNLHEAAMITGRTNPEDLCDTFLEWGAPMVALRMGASGSLVKGKSGEGWWLPAVPTEIVDVTGAGNSYCGGVLTGLGDGLSLLEASLRGVVSASLTLEQLGLPRWKKRPTFEANRRLHWARERVKML